MTIKQIQTEIKKHERILELLYAIKTLEINSQANLKRAQEYGWSDKLVKKFTHKADISDRASKRLLKTYQKLVN